MTTPSTKIAETMLGAMAGNEGELPVSEVAKHTPTPWTIKWTGNVFGANGERLVANTSSRQSNVKDEGPENKANAEFICLAANSHQALVDALLATKRKLHNGKPCWCSTASSENFHSAACDQASTALALAGETK